MNITIRPALQGQHEAVIYFDWFAGTGSFSIRATGLGSSPEAAEKEARLYIGQARAELNKVTAEETADTWQKLGDITTRIVGKLGDPA